MKNNAEIIYLDVCSLSRPFDDQSYIRIKLETDAVNLILNYVRNENFILMRSKVHDVEINSISDKLEKKELFELLDKYSKTKRVDLQKVKNRIEYLRNMGVGIADAAHVAYAESYDASFISCDDKLLKKCQKIDLEICCYNPLKFCEVEDLK